MEPAARWNGRRGPLIRQARLPSKQGQRKAAVSPTAGERVDGKRGDRHRRGVLSIRGRRPDQAFLAERSAAAAHPRWANQFPCTGGRRAATVRRRVAQRGSTETNGPYQLNKRASAAEDCIRPTRRRPLKGPHSATLPPPRRAATSRGTLHEAGGEGEGRGSGHVVQRPHAAGRRRAGLLLDRQTGICAQRGSAGRAICARRGGGPTQNTKLVCPVSGARRANQYPTSALTSSSASLHTQQQPAAEIAVV